MLTHVRGEMACGKRLPPRIAIPHESHKGKIKSDQMYTHRFTGRFIGSEVPSQLVKHNWFGTSHDWFYIVNRTLDTQLNN